jgi:hypothetical protein
MKAINNYNLEKLEIATAQFFMWLKPILSKSVRRLFLASISLKGMLNLSKFPYFKNTLIKRIAVRGLKVKGLSDGIGRDKIFYC